MVTLMKFKIDIWPHFVKAINNEVYTEIRAYSCLSKMYDDYKHGQLENLYETNGIEYYPKFLKYHNMCELTCKYYTQSDEYLISNEYSISNESEMDLSDADSIS